jgi:hypothetical protein
MLHLIAVIGKSASKLYMDQKYISDFKSLIRTVTSGRVLMVSTKFRSDLFYYSKESKSNEILKLWALYTKADFSNLDQNDYSTSIGDEESLSNYFLSINKMSSNWFHYRLYKKTFRQVYNHDPDNPVASMVLQCDQYLIENTDVKRTLLIKTHEKSNAKLKTDTFSLVMNYVNKKEIPN